MAWIHRGVMYNTKWVVKHKIVAAPAIGPPEADTMGSMTEHVQNSQKLTGQYLEQLIWHNA